LTFLGFIRYFRPKQFHEIDPRASSQSPRGLHPGLGPQLLPPSELEELKKRLASTSIQPPTYAQPPTSEQPMKSIVDVAKSVKIKVSAQINNIKVST
jgi:hypothetical protein